MAHPIINSTVCGEPSVVCPKSGRYGLDICQRSLFGPRGWRWIGTVPNRPVLFTTKSHGAPRALDNHMAEAARIATCVYFTGR